MLPKAARMESFDDDSTTLHSNPHGSTAHASAHGKASTSTTVPHIIVACPSCTTKFAVESSVVAAVEDPRFHCSRCDEVFSLEEVRSVMHRDLSSHDEAHDAGHDTEQLSAHEASGARQSSAAQPVEDETPQHVTTSTQSSVRLTPSRENPFSDRSTNATPSIPSPIRASDFTVAHSRDGATSDKATEIDSSPMSSQSPTQSFSAVDTTNPFEGTTYRNDDPSPATEAEGAATPKVFTSSITLDPTRSSEEVAPTQQTSTTRSGWVVIPDELLGATPESTSQAVARETHAAPTQPASPRADLITSRPASPHGAPLPQDKNARQTAPKSTPAPKVSGVQQELRFETQDYPTSLSRMQSLALISAPLFIALAALFIGSYSIRLSPETLGAGVSAITNIFGGESPNLPPAELTVTKVSLKMVRIPSREVVPVVTGVLSNRSQARIDGVTLEAVGFDSKGGLLLSAQAPLKSALSKEKVNELPLETIRKFQTSLSARSADIKPGEDVPFSIALIPDGSRDDQPSLAEIDLSQLKYFSARVFAVTSVKEVR